MLRQDNSQAHLIRLPEAMVTLTVLRCPACRYTVTPEKKAKSGRYQRCPQCGGELRVAARLTTEPAQPAPADQPRQLNLPGFGRGRSGGR